MRENYFYSPENLEVNREKSRIEIQMAGESLASETHPQRNEDSFFYDERQKALGVFDGMGGFAAGDEASRLAEKSVQDRIKTLNSRDETLTLQKVEKNFSASFKFCQPCSSITLLIFARIF